MLLALISLFLFAVTLLCAWSDVRSLRIPNVYSGIIIGCFALGFVLAPQAFNVWWMHVGAFVLMFVLAFGMFAAGLFGGGDVKFATAMALWVGLKGLFPFMFYMALMGGVVGGLSLYFKKSKPFKNPHVGGWVAQVQEGRNAVPYGIAIAFGAWAALFHTGFIHQQLDELVKIIH